MNDKNKKELEESRRELGNFARLTSMHAADKGNFDLAEFCSVGADGVEAGAAGFREAVKNTPYYAEGSAIREFLDGVVADSRKTAARLMDLFRAHAQGMQFEISQTNADIFNAECKRMNTLVNAGWQNTEGKADNIINAGLRSNDPVYFLNTKDVHGFWCCATREIEDAIRKKQNVSQSVPRLTAV